MKGLKAQQRECDKGVREFERNRDKFVVELKGLAKKGDLDSAKGQAKLIVIANKNIERLLVTKATLNSVTMQLETNAGARGSFFCCCSAVGWAGGRWPFPMLLAKVCAEVYPLNIVFICGTCLFVFVPPSALNAPLPLFARWSSPSLTPPSLSSCTRPPSLPSSAAALLKVTGVMEKSTSIMKAMSSLVKGEEVQAACREIASEMEKSEIISGLMEETMDGIEAPGMDEAVDELTQNVLFEITAGKMGKVGTAAIPGVTKKAPAAAAAAAPRAAAAMGGAGSGGGE